MSYKLNNAVIEGLTFEKRIFSQQTPYRNTDNEKGDPFSGWRWLRVIRTLNHGHKGYFTVAYHAFFKGRMGRWSNCKAADRYKLTKKKESISLNLVSLARSKISIILCNLEKAVWPAGDWDDSKDAESFD